MPESPVIAALAKQARDGLHADAEAAPYVHEKFCDKVLYGDPCGDTPCDCGWPHRILADVAARRTLLDEALGWEHHEADDPFYFCPASPSRTKADPKHAGPCDCDRDTRVRAVLTALAAPYQETEE